MGSANSLHALTYYSKFNERFDSVWVLVALNWALVALNNKKTSTFLIWKRGGFFERTRKVQTILARIFIALESESHGLSEN